MQCVILANGGKINTQTANTDGTCPSFVLLDANDYQAITNNIGLNQVVNDVVTPEQVLSVFAWGFGVVLFFWSLGYAVGVAKQAISKL